MNVDVKFVEKIFSFNRRVESVYIFKLLKVNNWFML